MRTLLALVVLALVALTSASCVDFGVDEEQYICRSQEECGEGFSCLRGPGCYCVCRPLDSQPNTSCDDQFCAAVETQ